MTYQSDDPVATNLIEELTDERDGLAAVVAGVRAQVQAVEAVIDNENVPDPDIRHGYELALRAVQRALDDPQSVLHPVENPPVRAVVGPAKEEQQ